MRNEISSLREREMNLKCQLGNLNESIVAQRETLKDENRMVNDETKKNNIRLIGELKSAHKKVIRFNFLLGCRDLLHILLAL